MNSDGELKPGLQSTEFWGMIISQLFAVFILLKWIPPGDAKSLEDALKQIIIGGITIAGNVGLVIKYVHDRGGLKKIALGNGNGNGNVSGPSVPPLK